MKPQNSATNNALTSSPQYTHNPAVIATHALPPSVPDGSWDSRTSHARNTLDFRVNNCLEAMFLISVDRAQAKASFCCPSWTV